MKNKYFLINFFSKLFRFMPQTSKIESKLHENQLCKNLAHFLEILSNIDISASRSSCSGMNALSNNRINMRNPILK